jgi:NAD(P)-dependent dehydrogenase (short-subunit alcohol dehydrogenase family)
MEPGIRRRAVVTGAASGMGRSCAERFLAEGWDVLAVDINSAGLEPLRAAGAATLVADLSDAPGREQTIATATAGRVDALVNAAGIILLKPIWDVTASDVRRVFATNAESTFFLCQQIGPRMTEGGAIVNFSSPSAKLATTVEAAVYAATKTAILSITRSFAYALAPRRIRVNAISPGITDTPMQDAVLREVSVQRGTTPEVLAATRLQGVPLGRTAPPEELAGVVWWMCADESTYLTGQCLNYDGGYVMC